MEGTYCSSDGTLYIKATNLQKFQELIEKAQKQADELQNTINQLEFFDFKFKFSAEDDS